MDDIKDLKAKADIINVIGSRIALKKRGSEFTGHCPRHDDSNASLTVNPTKQVFLCAPCGKGGDVFDYLEFHHGIDTGEAVKMLRTELGMDAPMIEGTVIDNKKPAAREDVWATEYSFSLQEIGIPTISHYKHGKPAKVYEYKGTEGNVLGYYCRFEYEEKGEHKKDVIPFTYCRNIETGKKEWRWRGFDSPRPLYGLNRLDKTGKRTVLLVEGEKAADAGKDLFPHVDVLTWPGGCAQWKQAHWNSLKGRNVLKWPDKDEPGFDVMVKIGNLLEENEIVRANKWIYPPTWAPLKWDVADADWSVEAAKDYARNNLSDLSPGPEQLRVIDPVPVEAPQSKKPQSSTNGHESFFKFLGFDKSESGTQQFHFFSIAGKVVIRLTPSAMSKSNLITLAPLSFWEQAFPQKAKSFDLDGAQNWIIAVQNSIGPFSDRNFRGRGAWMDDGRAVIHNGRELIVDRALTPLGQLKSKYVYESAAELGISVENPLQTIEANALLVMFELINVKRPIDRYLLAGWCVIAPICGALVWRPHLWLTGSAGLGKSWIMQKIIRPLLGETCLAVQSETTEAGVRQYLNHDALPVVFDEIEPTDKRSNDRVQNILSLMRAASSDDGGIMVKGSSAQQAKTFSIRSCFLFASIVVGLKQHSDKTRVTVIDLIEPLDQDLKKSRWGELQKTHARLMTPEFMKRFRSRSVNLLPTIVENARIFSNAVAAVLDDQRIGDQLGAMLAGAYSLTSSSLITYEKAVEFVTSKDWADEKYLDSSKDEHALLMFIFEHIARAESNEGIRERTVAELIAISMRWRTTDVVLQMDAAGTLRRMGIMCTEDANEIVVSNTSVYIKKLLSDTPWAAGHSKVLSRIDGAEQVETKRFGNHLARSVKLPLDLVRSVISERYELNNVPMTPNISANEIQTAIPSPPFEPGGDWPENETDPFNT